MSTSRTATTSIQGPALGRLRLPRLERLLTASALIASVAALSWSWQVDARIDDVAGARSSQAAMTLSALWPTFNLTTSPGAPAVGSGLGAPLQLSIPGNGKEWISPSPATTSGLVAAWCELKPGTAGTAIGSISKDKRTWTEISRASANANRSMPHVNLLLPVPAGYHFRLQMEGAKGQGLEIMAARGGHWFPLGG